MKKKEEMLSVIVPVYNSEMYIAECLESILAQTYVNLEVIVIDDGSVDKSGIICDAFTQKDTRVQVFHEENHGVNASRKLGVSKAKGKIVTFVDSDDWIEPNMYENMLKQYDNYEPDIITSGITIDRGVHTAYEIDTVSSGLYVGQQILEKILPIMMFDQVHGRRGITASLCNKIFLKSLLEEMLSPINSLITLGEDAVPVYTSIARADKIMVLEQSWYHYRINDNSMVQSYDLNSFEKIYILKEELKNSFLRNGIWEQMKFQVEQYLRPFLRSAIYKVYDIETEQISYIFPFQCVPQGSRLLLYGAGNVGKSYWNCLQSCNYVDVISWVDKNYEVLNSQGLGKIESPEVVKKVNFDYIFLAIENEQIAENIKSWLKGIGISEERIIWHQPERVGH